MVYDLGCCSHCFLDPSGQGVGGQLAFTRHRIWDTFIALNSPVIEHQRFGHTWYDVMRWWMCRYFHNSSTENIAFAVLHATQAQLRKDRWALNEDKIQVTCLPSNHLGNCITAQRDISQPIKDKLYSSHQLPKKKKKKNRPHTKIGCFAYQLLETVHPKPGNNSYSPYPESSHVWPH